MIWKHVRPSRPRRGRSHVAIWSTAAWPTIQAELFIELLAAICLALRCEDGQAVVARAERRYKTGLDMTNAPIVIKDLVTRASRVVSRVRGRVNGRNRREQRQEVWPGIRRVRTPT